MFLVEIFNYFFLLKIFGILFKKYILSFYKKLYIYLASVLASSKRSTTVVKLLRAVGKLQPSIE